MLELGGIETNLNGSFQDNKTNALSEECMECIERRERVLSNSRVGLRKGMWSRKTPRELGLPGAKKGTLEWEYRGAI